MTVFVVESGEYEMRDIDGVYATLDAAIQGIKGPYTGPDFEWSIRQEKDYTIVSTVSDRLPVYWCITPYEVKQ